MNEFIKGYILETIHLFSDKIPSIVLDDTNNYVILYWPIEENQDGLWDMFGDKNTMNFYFDDVINHFEDLYKYKMDIHYCMGPIDIGDKIYSRIILYYYINTYQNTNTFFVA